MLSHPHPDHFMGFDRGLRGVRVDSVWDTGQGEREGVSGGYAAWLARARGEGSVVLHPDVLCGKRVIGGAEIEVVAPCPSIADDEGPNDNSFVVRIRHGSRSVLLVGDAERAEEARVIATGANLRADVLKVGHHGSRTSTSAAFLDAVGPAHAVISTGARNRFGHPHPATLATLAARPIHVWRTDREGAVVVETDGKALRVSSIKSGRPGGSSGR